MEERHIGLELKAVDHAIKRSLDARFSRNHLEGLYGIQGPIVGYLVDHREKDVYQKDIEKAFNIRRSSATALLQALEQKEYIRRESIKQDGRMKKIVLTDKAVEANAHVRMELKAFDDLLERNISLEEKAVFLRVLDQISENLRQEDEK